MAVAVWGCFLLFVTEYDSPGEASLFIFCPLFLFVLFSIRAPVFGWERLIAGSSNGKKQGPIYKFSCPISFVFTLSVCVYNGAILEQRHFLHESYFIFHPSCLSPSSTLSPSSISCIFPILLVAYA